MWLLLLQLSILVQNSKHDDSEKKEMKSAAWQQVTGAIGHSADGLYNTSFYCDACSEFPPLSIFETDVICVSVHADAPSRYNAFLPL